MRHYLRWIVWLNLSASILGCQTLAPLSPTNTKVPLLTLWNGRIYLGDSRRLGVATSLASPVISCSSPEFDKMACMSVEDYTALMQYFLAAACSNVNN